MSPRTIFLSRLLGLYYLLVSLFMFTHKQATVEMVTALFHNPSVLFAVALLVMLAGLAMILSHNVWSAGTLPMIVTLVGWVALIKSLLLLFLSPEAASGLFLAGFHYAQFFYLYSAISLLLGVYLTYGGLVQAVVGKEAAR